MRAIGNKIQGGRATQGGQATVEFIGAMLLFVPLMLAVVFSGKYADIKHQTIQASRYAAMGRALDPHNQVDDTTLGTETVARFFRDGAMHPIATNESLGATALDENPNWSELNSTPLLTSYKDVAVSFRSNFVTPTAPTPLEIVGSTMLDDVKTGYGVEADVEVKVAEVAQFANYPALKTLGLKIKATTVMAGDAWNGGGAGNVADHLNGISVPTRLASPLNKVPGVNVLFEWLAGAPAPDFGCVKADVVPDYVAPGASYDPVNDSCN